MQVVEDGGINLNVARVGAKDLVHKVKVCQTTMDATVSCLVELVRARS